MFWGFDPAKSANFRSLNGVDPNLKVEQSDEFLLGIERELFPDFSLSATAILRRNHSFIWGTFYDKETRTILRRSDYVGPIAGSVTYDFSEALEAILGPNAAGLSATNITPINKPGPLFLRI